MWEASDFGTTKAGVRVQRYSASSEGGLEVSVCNYGATITGIRAPDRHGRLDDVVAGYDDVTGYEAGCLCFGGTMGRCTNRIGQACFSIDGSKFTLARNDGSNSIHGGLVGFHKRVWKAEVDGTRLVMAYTSADLEEGYPGEVKVTACFQLDGDTLHIECTACTDKPTIVNLTNHAGFNLAGHKAESVRDHLIQVHAEKFTPKDECNIPTGELANVQGTVFDLRRPVLLGDRLDQVPGDIGYDHNFCIQGDGPKTLVARLEHEGSGRRLDVFSNQPGAHLYTGYYINNEAGKDGALYTRYSSVAFETQNYPDAINKPNFPNSVLRPGQVYRHLSWFQFSNKSS